MLALPTEAAQWSLTNLREPAMKIGAGIVRHGRSLTFQMANVIMLCNRVQKSRAPSRRSVCTGIVLRFTRRADDRR
jgi:hypothetical protein